MTAGERRPGGRAIASGGIWMLFAQMVIACTQVTYTAVTSRILAPEDFGSFAVALAAAGLVALVLSSGLPAAVLATRELSDDGANSLVLMSMLAGLLGSALLLVGAPVWAVLWQAPQSVSLMRLLAIYTIFVAPAALQLAFLRREGRTCADAAIQSISAVVAVIAGIIAVHAFQHAWALIVNPTCMMMVSLLLSAALRRKRFAFRMPRDWRHVAHTAGNVSVHSVGFWILMTSPTWAISFAFDESVLGQFSRAFVITVLPASALTTVFIRSLQPYYRYLSSDESRRAAVSDVSILAVAAAVPIFVFIACTSRPLILILLGPGWEAAAAFATPMACGYGVYFVYSVLTNALETMHRFRVVRRGQAAMLCAAAVTGASVVATHLALLGASMILVVALVGIFAVFSQLRGEKMLVLGEHVRAVAAQVALSLFSVGLALGSAWGVVNVVPVQSEVARAAFFVVVAGASTAVVLVTTARWQPAVGVLRRRGVLEVGRKRGGS